MLVAFNDKFMNLWYYSARSDSSIGSPGRDILDISDISYFDGEGTQKLRTHIYIILIYCLWMYLSPSSSKLIFF